MAFKLSFKSIALGTIGAFIAVQIISLLLSAIFPSLGVIKGGPALLYLLLGVGIMTLFLIGTNIESLKAKETLIFVIIVFSLLGLAYWKLPSVFPQIFSISPEVSDAIRNTIGQIFSGGLG